jgi:phage terminase large subunit
MALLTDQELLSNAVAKAEFPVKLACLFEPKRYKVLYGGRGGAKSWGVARALLIKGAKDPLRILCAREFQVSIKDSVHKLLADQIAQLGLSEFYEVTNTSIKGRNGTEFFFAGLKNNIMSIKSFEGVDICWCEEAQTISKTSWNVLIPTIRRDNSEIWVTFNPELETDDTYQRFVISPPESAIVQKITWRDNPWFPQTLREEKENLEIHDHNAYLNVWEGLCRRTVDGAVFAQEMTLAEMDGRITKVPYDAIKPVHAVFDLGWADNTAIWFVQFIGFEIRLIRYLEDNQKTMSYYLSQLQSLGYVYDTIWLPHDAENTTLAAAGRSIADIVRGANYKVQILPRVPVTDSINAARTIFQKCYFDKENCHQGLQCLRHYRYDVDPDTKQFSKSPLHDIYSHGADAFRYIGLVVNEPRKAGLKKPVYQIPGSWMG